VGAKRLLRPRRTINAPKAQLHPHTGTPIIARRKITKRRILMGSCRPSERGDLFLATDLWSVQRESGGIRSAESGWRRGKLNQLLPAPLRGQGGRQKMNPKIKEGQRPRRDSMEPRKGRHQR